MSWLSFEELKLERKRYDAAVRQTPEIDVFCSTSHWILPAQRVYAPGTKPFIWRTENAYCVFMLVQVQADVICAMPLEIGWGLACPLIGVDAERVVGGLASALSRASLKPDYVLVTGLSEEGRLSRALDARFGGRMRLEDTQICERRVASLDGGIDAYLARRSPKFRADLRRSERNLDRSGATADYLTSGSVDEIIHRVVAVEQESWKGQSEQGVDTGLPLDFYREIIETLLDKGTFRALFIQKDGLDIGFAFGGIEGSLFRGLQLSYRRDAAALSPGNMAQLKLLRCLTAEGVETYDLGMDMPYKARWARTVQRTYTAVIAVP